MGALKLHRFGILVFAIVLALGVANRSNAEDYPHDLAHGNSPPLDLSAPDCCKTIFSQKNQPKWLGRILNKLRSAHPGQILSQHALFNFGGQPKYLAVIWLKRIGWGELFQLYRVRVRSANDVRLSGLIERRDSLLSFNQATGRWRDLDGSPLIVLEHGSGGTSWLGYWMEILTLNGGVHDITPHGLGRPIRIQDWNHDGMWELVTSDDRWANFYFGCGPCGPFVPIVLKRTPTGFRPACREHAAYIRDRAKLYEGWLAKVKEEHSWVYFQYAANEMLSRLQVGDLRAAHRIFRDLTKISRWEKRQTPLTIDDLDATRKFAEMTNQTFGPIVKQVSNLKNANCLVSAIEAEQKHPDLEERINRFRQ